MFLPCKYFGPIASNRPEMSLPFHACRPVATVWERAIFRRLRDFVGLRPPTSLAVRLFEARRAEGGISRRAGREERCDDREAPDGAKRNRNVPWGTDAERRGGRRMKSRSRSERSSASALLLKRRRRDSNPRNVAVQQFSRLPPSTTRPHLQKDCKFIYFPGVLQKLYPQIQPVLF